MNPKKQWKTNPKWSISTQTGRNKLPMKDQKLSCPQISLLHTECQWKKFVNWKFHINQFIVLIWKQQKTFLGPKDLENIAANTSSWKRQRMNDTIQVIKTCQYKNASDEYWDYLKTLD